MPIAPLYIGGTGLDTAEKRASAAWVIIPLMPGITVNADKDVQWRYQSAWTYSGLTAIADVVGRRYRGFTVNVGRLMNQ